MRQKDTNMLFVRKGQKVVGRQSNKDIERKKLCKKYSEKSKAERKREGKRKKYTSRE